MEECVDRLWKRGKMSARSYESIRGVWVPIGSFPKWNGLRKKPSGQEPYIGCDDGRKQRRRENRCGSVFTMQIAEGVAPDKNRKPGLERFPNLSHPALPGNGESTAKQEGLQVCDTFFCAIDQSICGANGYRLINESVFGAQGKT